MRSSSREYWVMVALTIGLLVAGATAPATVGHGPTQTAAPPAGSPGTGAIPGSAVAGGEEDIRDIRAPKPLPKIWPWVALGCAATSAPLIGWLIWRRIASDRMKEPSPRDIALGRLEAARRWMEPGHAREYCYEVSEVIRGFIEQRFQILAPRETTEEFLRDILGSYDQTLVAHRGALSEFLGHCDLAKYAGWQFAVQEMESMHASARALVTLASGETGVEPATGGDAGCATGARAIAAGGAA